MEKNWKKLYLKCFIIRVQLQKIFTISRGSSISFSQYWLVGLKFSNIRMIQKKAYMCRSNCLYKDYYSQKITVEDIANYLALNRSYLYTIFMNSLGISPKDFLTEFRISRGKEQLALTNLSVEEIAVSCGYRNSLAFGKVFKQKVGITPTQYRNDNRKDARDDWSVHKMNWKNIRSTKQFM